MRVRTFYDHIYRVPFLVCVGGTRAKAHRKAVELLGFNPSVVVTDERSGVEATTFTDPNIKGIAFYFREMVKGDSGLVRVIAHEATHASHIVLSRSGCLLDAENDEAEAYYTAWLAETLYTIARPQRRRRRTI